METLDFRKEILKKVDESSLSRLWRHNIKHDCAALTAFRYAEDCGLGEVYSKDDNKARNKSLLSKLKSKGFSVTTLKGVYPESGVTRKETSYFVVDIDDTGDLKKSIRKLGTEFDQDSILFIPKGSIDNKSKAYLIGTNKCENSWIGYGNKDYFDTAKLGYNSPIYTSKVNGRPFLFESVGSEFYSTRSGYGQLSLDRASKKHWTEFKSVDESSLSRVYRLTQKHESGSISAFRYAEDCGLGDVYSKKENLKRSSVLKAKLLKLGYGVTKIDGTYIENYNTSNEIEVKEQSFIVVDIKDTGTLKKDLKNLAFEFDQDSITYSLPSGEYYLIGTNKCEDSYPGYNKEIKLGKPLFGKGGEFHSKVNGRPFVFEKYGKYSTIRDYSISEIRSITELSKN